MPEISRTEHMEILKLEFEYLKYLTTVCTVSVILIIAFLDKLFTHPEWKFTIAISLCAFLVAILVCILAALSILFQADEGPDKPSERSEDIEVYGTLVAFVCFGVGIIFMVIFGLKNLF
jgi:hypothetical protein